MIRAHRAAKHLALAALVLLGAAAPASAASWASFRGDLGTGVAAEGLPPGDGPLGLELAWKRPLGSGYSGVSIADGFLVTAYQAGERDVVAAFDPATGEERWRYDLAPAYAGHDGSHDGPIATPAIAGGRVFMVGPSGHVAALDLASGEALWTAHLVDDLGCEPPYYGFAGSPLVVGDAVMLLVPGEGGSLAAFDAATGELRWRAGDDEVAAQSPILAEIAGREQVVAIGLKKISGFDPSDGAVLWEHPHEGSPGGMGAMTSSPMPVGGDRLFLKYEDPQSMVVAVTAEGGELAAERLAHSRGMTRSYSPATLSDGTVYGYTARFLSAVDPATGELLWRSRDVGDGFVIAVDGYLVALEKTGGLHLGPASPGGWSASARLELFEGELAWTPPSYAGGAIYARSLGELARVDVVRGAALVAEAGESVLPAPLAELAERVAGAESPVAVVDEFLAGRELPLVDGEDVVFLWRGAAEDVAIAGDMIGMRREEPMTRLAGTDLWWWHTRLDRRARMSYLFYIDYQPTVDPTHERTVTSTVLGPDMNWNRGEPVKMSWFAMPEWPGRVGAPAATQPASEARGRLETFELAIQRTAPEGEEALEPVTASIHVWLPPGYDRSDERYPVAYVHHGAARDEGLWIETLAREVGRSVAPLIVVFPEIPRASGLRGTFAGQVVPAVDERYRTLAEREGRANVGMGWPGYQAAMQTFGYPDTFGMLGVQSLFLLEEHMKRLEGAIGEGEASTLPMRIYLEWGRWDLISPHEEMNFRASSRWAWGLFESKGWRPLGGEVWDSTDFASWRNRTAVLLRALFPAESAETGAGLDRWLTTAP